VTDAAIERYLNAAQALVAKPHEQGLISRLWTMVEVSDYSAQDRRLALGAAFDLLVTAEYYSSIGHHGWQYCAEPSPTLFYPYTNTCPRCIFDGRFEHHKANKPRAGSIGEQHPDCWAYFCNMLFCA
jgi:hypothetical protein